MDTSQLDAFNLGDILADPQGFAQKVQDIRNQIAMANSQTADVAANRFTLNNVAAQWRAMDPAQQTNLVLLGAVIVWAFIARKG